MAVGEDDGTTDTTTEASAKVEKGQNASYDLVEDTASSSSREDNEEGDSEVGSDVSSGEENEEESEADSMPLLNFTRLFGALPRAQPSTDNAEESNNKQSREFSVASTCAVMGQVLLSPDTVPAAAPAPANTSTNTSSNPLSSPVPTTAASEDSQQTPHSTRPPQVSAGDPLLSQQPHYVVAMGFENGLIELVDARTAMAVVPPHQLKLREDSSHREPIVDISMDSSGTFLAGVDAGRMACIWEFKYTTTSTLPQQQQQQQRNSVTSQQPQQQQQQQQETATRNEPGVFSSFMSAFTGSTPSNSNNNAATAESTSTSESPQVPPQSVPVPTLTTSSVQMSRISYPRSFGVPTRIAMDPSYKRKREKAILTGFLDGRLVLTKRGMIFQRRTDAIIYQGTYENNNHSGIEAIEWRGSLAAWADASGIRLFDTESLTRIAHIDRPTGARLTLYPTLSSLRPTLRFETSNYLLVAWGDCLMGLSITDHGQSSPSTGGQNNHANDVSAGAESNSPQPQQQQQAVVRRRTVECAMAWELDCVACGCAPLDAQNVVVLGLVTPADDEEEEEGGDSSNDLEVQIVSKMDGTIVYSNILPLARNSSNIPKSRGNANAHAIASEPATVYKLLSSFALPRMEDSFEAQEENFTEEEFDVQVSLFSPSSRKRFVDSHLKWDMKALVFDDDSDNVNVNDDKNEDASSVDSDDYGFIFRSIATNDEDGNNLKTVMPPLMVIASNSDAVLARMRDVDDAIDHALAAGKTALALRRALRQKRRMRRFRISDLVSGYFYSLLRVPRKDTAADSIGSSDTTQPLSIRRLKLAAKAMPVLFGGDIQLWERWVFELESIPGALFVLSDFLPVRDPKLPKNVYTRVLTKMLEEIDELTSATDEGQAQVCLRAQECFLDTLTGWGPTNFLKEYIKLCKCLDDGDDMVRRDAISHAEKRFARRFTQTSAGYLDFPVPREPEESGAQIRSEGYYDAKRALFDVSVLLDTIALRTPAISGASSSDSDSASQEANGASRNSPAALDALARLNMMQGQFDVALKCFLAIAALHSARPLEDFEAGAVDCSDSAGEQAIFEPWKSKNGLPYTIVLQVIDSHHLHQWLLEEKFLSSLKAGKVLPLCSLLQLVGLRRMGDFLIEHCVAPQSVGSLNEYEDLSGGQNGEWRGTLPLDLVAKQLEGHPKLLSWYLHLVFTRKPELYVKFPNTAYPPKSVTELHRKHFDLYLQYSGSERDSARVLSGVETYKVGSITTPLLCFLKAALPLGGIRPQDARSALESERQKDEEEFSSTFALELAYIKEHFGEETVEEALQVLDLYMKGAESLTLAVSFAQRNQEFSTILWKVLIEHCLKTTDNEASDGGEVDGSLFGSLLEAAALFGADLAHLVTQIPHGMDIEGLRPRLVAAVADYRLKLKMHEAASEAASEEMVSILRELSHRSRRGARFQFSPRLQENHTSQQDLNKGTSVNNGTDSAQHLLPKTVRTVERCDRHKLSLAPPIR